MKKIKKSYQNSYKKYGVSPRALKWCSEKAARQRYEQIIMNINFYKQSILDVGCGFGDIIPYITEKADIFDYTGIDIVPEFIREAKKIYPKHKFIVSDYFKQPLKEKFDIIICCGTLNRNYNDNLGFRKKQLKLCSSMLRNVLSSIWQEDIRNLKRLDTAMFGLQTQKKYLITVKP